MSSNNATPGSNPTGSFSLMNLCGRVIFDGSNFTDWIRNIRMVTRYENKEYVLDKELKVPEPTTLLRSLLNMRHMKEMLPK